MADPQTIIQELQPSLEEILQDAIRDFKSALEAKGLVLTGKLRDSFTYHIISEANLEGTIDFEDYGRLKDLKSIYYENGPPAVEVMQDYVNLIGVDKFAYVPGYKKGKMPTVNRAVSRIAWGLVFNRIKEPSVKRKFKGTWYNMSKVKTVSKATKKIGTRYAQMVTQIVADDLEKTE
ncbi:hypothetical protein BWI97_08635 [Siphonobacter sp. BAB-5405]|uniref:hypothetical protein n=1 Tax=Siphonobacter sp. BAB-5405 TaxID=1864825 RepID=UPI000C7FCD41|nr:hypothetical protein [Siphonobacter sp. BAB-5405]PMD97665.1 hypothetical protein BWI97_08635 [Siphonobacter sp. BAB-5405]